MQSINNLIDKYFLIISSDYKTFEEVASLKNMMGVYMIYNQKNELIYVGKTNKFHIRFGTDLKHESTHTLVKKLIKDERFSTREIARNFLQKECTYKIEFCTSNREAEALEAICIYLLNPLYNK